MNVRRLSLKFEVSPDPTATVELHPWIPLFHRFIQHGRVEGLLVDVADYAHVPNGPGVLLVAHEVDYGIDLAGGRAGLVVVRKRCGDLPLAETLRDTLRKAFVAMRAVEEDGSTGLRFDRRRFVLRLLDRLAAPNSDEGFEALAKEAEPVLRELFGDAGLEIQRVGAGDARGALSLCAAVPAVDDAALVERLGGARLAPPVPVDEEAQSPWDVPVEELKRLRDEGADFVLVDVREVHEYEEVNLEGRLVPLAILEERLGELDRGAHVLVHCKKGDRGAKAVETLRRVGFENAWNVRGGLDAWIERIGEPGSSSS